ncbi:hypothetical protein PDJAM_G00155230 [Pangasius djambal]|uniref:Uncharacterized protein n=1 Tax=Pangasius djambal TaxID=1691987 RepID=A0ACC5ZKD3_9TELE|nr:hypothetical protein [Pangasius djambal]
MDIRSHLLLALLLLKIHEVSVQSITVEAVLGDSVILACSSIRYEQDVFWRHNNSKSVYDIIDGGENFHDQDPGFRGRVKGFPSEFTKGNYSIKLSDVKPTDRGTYTCQIPDSSPLHVELKIKERRILEPKPNARNSGVMRRAGGVSLLPLVYVLLCSFAV